MTVKAKMPQEKSRSELKREAILNAASDAFQTFGVHNTSMDKLAALAGVSKRTVYNHFSSKEALVMELLSVLWKSSISADTLAQISTCSVKQQLITLLHQEICVIAQPGYLEMAKVAMGHFMFKPDELQEQLKTMSKEDTALHVWLEQQSESGALKVTNVELARNQLHNLIKGSAFWPQVMGACPPLTEEEGLALAENTANLFLGYYLKSEQF
ncbi:TetR/AcrR family transcriptional regulator [Enterovibrio coralii]|uniref:TetR family transcriptional regulator n=1 Tax=Enterovibrio coralii TaxID=294935 RepID=A0A135ICX3_9GAMM|nr:TetR/AcrR family transcriptional regulator [Enterovibrio coralii]KXF83327.1 TetR family transcriptional regulator [Enterovibrio coralii]